MLSIWKEFRPSILFLMKFLGIYLAANVLYGLFIESYKPWPDPITETVSNHTCLVLNTVGYSTAIAPHPTLPSVIIRNYGNSVISVYEGCNSINVMIVFLAFMLAFGPFSKRKILFMGLGLVIIYLINLARVTFLFWVAESMPDYLYFVHKYVFTAMIYMVVLVMWYLWIFRINEKPVVSS